MTTQLHIRSVLDRDLATLQANVVRMSSLTEFAIRRSIQALEVGNIEYAQEVIAGDHEINRLRYEVEEMALLVLALQEPKAGDLRRVIAIIHIAVELERMADHAVGIARLVERMQGLPPVKATHELPKMSERVIKMIHKAIDAFVGDNADKARDIMGRDRKVNRSYDRLFGVALAEMQDDDYVEVATYLLWMGHNLERIGDRAVNIAERVVFMCTGNLTESLTTDYDVS